jgi:4-hydroxythreonine-4-phosphate dehydrogenase
MEVVDLDNLDSGLIERGEVNPLAGKAAFEYLQCAVSMALKKDIEAVVTAPLNKEALNKSGYHYPGHTEILAELCGVEQICMMLVVGNLRVAHVSWHLSLREACNFLSKERILTTLKLGLQAVGRMGIGKPRVAVAGLNPHAGESGLLGEEEIIHIIPAVKEARCQGIDVVGPIPPDTLFYRAKKGEFDLIIAMYHDQGHIPLKMLGFFEGVNITLGLPIIRTSVAHGTAFDQVGKGTASPESLIKAVELAVQLVSE